MNNYNWNNAFPDTPKSIKNKVRETLNHLPDKKENGEIKMRTTYKKSSLKKKIIITSDLIRGHTETIILARLIKEDSYGYEINKYIKSKTNNEYELKEVTLYTAFIRLEENNLIIYYWGNENKGARRKYYSITDKGKEAYEKYKLDWKETKNLIDSLT